MRRAVMPSGLMLAILMLLLAVDTGRAADWARVQSVLAKVERHISRLSIKVEELERQNQTISRGVNDLTRRRGQGGASDVRTAQFLLDRLTAMDVEGSTLRQEIQRKRVELATFQQRIDLAFPERRRDVSRFFGGLMNEQRKAERSHAKMTRRSAGLKDRLSRYLQTYAGSMAASRPTPSRPPVASAPRPARTVTPQHGGQRNIYDMAAEAARRSATQPAERSDRMDDLLSRYQVGGRSSAPATAPPAVSERRPPASRPYQPEPSAGSASVTVRRSPSAAVPTLAPPVMVVPKKPEETDVSDLLEGMGSASGDGASSSSTPSARAVPKPAPAKPAPAKPAPAMPAPAKPAPKPAPAKPAPAKPAPAKPAPPAAKGSGEDDSELDEFLELEEEAALPRPRRTEGLIRLGSTAAPEETDLFADRIEAELRRQIGEGKTAYFDRASAAAPTPVRPPVTAAAHRRQVAGRVQNIIDELNALSRD